MRKTLVFVVMLWISLFIFSRTDSGNATEDLPAEEKQELLEVLQRVLEKLQYRRMTSCRENHSHIPRCSVGDFCAVKKGSRFGLLCECPHASRCSLFFLKCL